MQTGEPVIGIEVAGQRADQNDERSWITYWHPLRGPNGDIVGVNVAAEEITERKRAEAALQASERQFHTLGGFIPQLVWMADAGGTIFWFNNRWYEYTGHAAGRRRALMTGRRFLRPTSLQKPASDGRRRLDPEPRWRWNCRCSARTASIAHS